MENFGTYAQVVLILKARKEADKFCDLIDKFSTKNTVNTRKKAKEDIIKRMKLMEVGYFPKFYNDKPDSYNFHISKCIPFEADKFIRRALEFTETIDCKFKEPEGSGAFGKVYFYNPGTNLDKLDILPMILDRWEGGEFDWMDAFGKRNHSNFGDLFSMKPAVIPNEKGPDPKRSHRGLVSYSCTWRLDIPFVGWVLNEFCVAMDDPTVQQRIKSLLILKAITDRELSAAFGVGKLDKIIVVESNEGNYLRPGDEDGQYLIGLDVSKKDDSEYVIVQIDKSNQLEESQVALSTKSPFFNEAMHRIYHYVIAPWQLSPVMPNILGV